MKRLGTRVNLIPVVAKADTLTQNDLFVFKQRVRGNLSFYFSLTQAHSHNFFFLFSALPHPTILGSRSYCCSRNPDLYPSNGG